MRASHLKYYVGIIIIFVIDSLHNIFFENNDRIDVYLLYDHKRYVTNILYDVSNLFRFSLLTYWLMDISRTVFKPLFYLSLLTWLSYFIFYNQIASLVIVPIYIIIAMYFNKKSLLWEKA